MSPLKIPVSPVLTTFTLIELRSSIIEMAVDVRGSTFVICPASPPPDKRTSSSLMPCISPLSILKDLYQLLISFAITLAPNVGYS